MKNLLTSFFFFFLANVYSQTTSVSGIINSYASVTGISCQSVNVSTTSGFNPGDRAILIQMKGAVIDTSNSTSFGTILNYKNAGNYELVTISSVAGNTITFSDSIIKLYSLSGIVQLVKAAAYTNVVVSGPLTCQAWNGSTGGVLAVIATGNVIMNSNIDVSGKGFMGAAVSNGSLVSCQGDTSNYMSTSASLGSAKKGEGIVIANFARTNGKGPLGNGGGGGTDCNGGGAGGGNYGQGGHGGNSECNVSCPPYFYQNSGGYPGDKLIYSNLTNKIFLGGGGGAGHQNNYVGTAGTNGGGIVIIKADTLFGNNYFIQSNGINNTIVAGNDGQGGGGAGGTVLISVSKDSLLKVSVQGGSGGVDNFSGTDCHGKGGGGAGGIVWTFKPTSTMTTYLSGGAPGIFTYPSSYCYNTSNGAAAGQPGYKMIDLIIPKGIAPCASNDIKTFLGNQIDIVLSPNPFSSYLLLKTEKPLENLKIVFYDVLGNEIKKYPIEGKETKIDRDNLAHGLYFYKIIQDNKILVTGKLIAN